MLQLSSKLAIRAKNNDKVDTFDYFVGLVTRSMGERPLKNGSELLRFVPFVYLVSPSTGRRLAIALHAGLAPADAADLSSRAIKEPWEDSANDVLQEKGLVNLLRFAEDWRFMTEQEVIAFTSELPPFFDDQHLFEDHFNVDEFPAPLAQAGE